MPCFGKGVQTNLEGFLFPATYDFVRGDDLEAARAGADPGVLPQLPRRSTSRYARSKNLTPYDVLKIASMVEREAVGAVGAAARSRP